MICCGVVINNGKILMVKKGGEPFKGDWCPPGGKQKDNETLEETCVREVKEEVNLNVEISRKLLFLSKNDTDEETTRLLEKFNIGGIYFFLCKPLSDLNNIKKSSDAADLKWLSKGEALKMNLTAATREFLNRVNI